MIARELSTRKRRSFFSLRQRKVRCAKSIYRVSVQLCSWWYLFTSSHIWTFFEKGNILISQRYQLHLVAASTKSHKDIQDAHSQRKKNKGPITVIDSSQQPHTNHHQIQHPKNIKGLQKQCLLRTRKKQSYRHTVSHHLHVSVIAPVIRVKQCFAVHERRWSDQTE